MFLYILENKNSDGDTSLKERSMSKVRNKPYSQHKHSSVESGSKEEKKKFFDDDGVWGSYKDYPKQKDEYKSLKPEWKCLDRFTEDIRKLQEDKGYYGTAIDTGLDKIDDSHVVVRDMTYFILSIQLNPFAKDEEGYWMNFFLPASLRQEALCVAYDYFAACGITTREMNKAFKKVVCLDVGRNGAVYQFVKDLYPQIEMADVVSTAGDSRTSSPIYPLAVENAFRTPLAIEMSNAGIGKPKDRKGKRREKHKFITYKPKVYTNKNNQDVMFAPKKIPALELIKREELKLRNKYNAQESWH